MNRRIVSTSLLLILFILMSDAAVGAQTPVPASIPPGAVPIVPNPLTEGEAFGSAAMLDGDTLVVGAPAANVGSNEQQGAAIIFERAGAGSWQQIKRITANDGSAFDGFGAAVAIHGDTIVVGAVYATISEGEVQQGVAYVFARNEGGADQWGQVKKLSGSLGDGLDNFGSSLVVKGDDLFITAPNQGNGMVYHYRRNQGGDNQWGEAQQLFDAGGRKSDNFGSALAFDGETLVVGSQRSDITDLFENDGAVFLYTFDAGADAWQEADKLIAGDASPNDRFGYAVGLYGDVIAVGAPFSKGDDGKNSVGKVYIFERDNGQWSEIDLLRASDPSEVANFGLALVVTAEGVLVSSSQDNGVLYAFQPAPTIVAQGENGAQASTWREIARYAAGTEYFQSSYGRVLAAAGKQIVIGAPQFELAKGGVYLHDEEDIFVEAPESTSTTAFLPVLAKEAIVLQVTGQLKDGGKVFGPDGMGIAAPAGSLAAPVKVSLLRAGAPGVEHDASVQPAGEPYLIGADVSTRSPMALPFILALPVGAGVDTTKLALAALVPSEEILDATGAEEEIWLYFEGEYDAPNQRFLATWPVLPAKGVTLGVVEHPSFDSRVGVQAAATTAPAASQFKIQCVDSKGAGAECSEDIKATVAGYLVQIHERMTDAGGFEFEEPLLRNLAEQLDFDRTSLASLGYMAYIEVESKGDCSGNAGYYHYPSGRLVLCLAPGDTIDEVTLATLIHEYFHATEHGYDAVLKDEQAYDAETWVLEGMASAAEESYFLDNNLRRSNDFGIHYVDISFISEQDEDEYSAQDFWVYVGQQLSGAGANMGYFKNILRYGANISAVDDGLKKHYGTNFKDQLWDWASNQVFEKENNLDGALGNTCVLEEAVLKQGIQYPWKLLAAPRTSYWPAGNNNATVPAYTTMVVQMIFPNDSSVEIVAVEYPECENNTDFDAWAECNKNAQNRIPVQMYAENVGSCFDSNLGRLIDPEINAVAFPGVQRSRRYFTVITNVTASDQFIRLKAELGGGP